MLPNLEDAFPLLLRESDMHIQVMRQPYPESREGSTGATPWPLSPLPHLCTDPMFTSFSGNHFDYSPPPTGMLFALGVWSRWNELIRKALSPQPLGNSYTSFRTRQSMLYVAA